MFLLRKEMLTSVLGMDCRVFSGQRDLLFSLAILRQALPKQPAGVTGASALSHWLTFAPHPV